MENLKQLRAKLLSVQNKPNANKLSERNVVDIVQKLVDNYNLELIFTLSGKEYLTPTRLIQDITNEVNNEGRVNLLDLPSVLNVSVEQIEKYASSVVNKNIFFINGQLLSSFYLENLCQEINISLQEAGQVSLADLTIKYSLPMSFLKDQIDSRLGGAVQAQFSQNNVLVTDAYLIRHQARLRGALRAATKPFDLKAFDQSLVNTQVKSLIASSQVKGDLDGLVFTPNVYRNAVWDEVKSYYFVNRYIEYDYIKRKLTFLGLNDYKKVCEKLEGGDFLSGCYVQIELLNEFKAKIQEFTKNKPFIDFYDLELPNCLSEEDLESLVCEGIYTTSHYLFTDKATEQAINLLSPLIKAFSEETKDQAKGKKKETLSIQAIQSELKKKKFLNAPVEFLEGFSDSVYSKVSQKITENKQTRSNPTELVPDTLLQDFNYLYICNKSLTGIQKQYPNIKPLQAHLSKSLCSSFLSDLLKVQLQHHGVQIAAIKPNDRPKLISKLPDYLKEIFAKLSEKIASKDAEGFINELLGNIKDIPIVSIKAVDKKTERMILYKLKSETKASLKKTLDSQGFVEAGMLGCKLKLIDNGLVVETPNEKWGISTMLQVYEVIVGRDVVLEFLRLSADNSPSDAVLAMVPEYSAALSLNN